MQVPARLTLVSSLESISGAVSEEEGCYPTLRGKFGGVAYLRT